MIIRNTLLLHQLLIILCNYTVFALTNNNNNSKVNILTNYDGLTSTVKNFPDKCKTNTQIIVNRRDAFRWLSFGSAFLTSTRAANANNNSIYNLFETDFIPLPSPSQASEFQGVDNMHFPLWLEGTWDVTQTLVGTKAPLGLEFIGGPNGDLGIAEKSMKEQMSLLNIPVKLQLRWVKTRFGVCEDRLFNTRQRLDSFAGKKVVAEVQYADVGGSNRQSVLAMGGKDDDPLQTTLVYFKGPAAQKTFMIAHKDEKLNEDGSKWSGLELSRSIFALTNKNVAPPITTDSEAIWFFEKIDNETVSGKLRLASFLNAQQDKFYFQTKNRAVSIAEYTLDLKRADTST